MAVHTCAQWLFGPVHGDGGKKGLCMCSLSLTEDMCGESRKWWSFYSVQINDMLPRIMRSCKT